MILLVGDFPPAPTGFANVNYHIAKLLKENTIDFRAITHVCGEDRLVIFNGFKAWSIGRYQSSKIVSLLSGREIELAILSAPWFLLREVISALNQLGIPFIVYTTCEGSPAPDYITPMLQADRIFTPSEFSKQFLLEHVPNSMVEVLPHGIDTQLFQPTQEPEDIFFCPCNCEDPRKQVERVIEAFRKIPGNYTLMVSGRLKLERVVGTWQSKLPSLLEMPQLYSRSRVVVMAGCEGFGIPCVEAYSCMRPVVALDTPPYTEIITDRKYLATVTGFAEKSTVVDVFGERFTVKYMLPIPDVEDLAEKMLDALDTPAEEMRHLREVALEKYNYQVNYKRFLDFI